MINEIRSIGFYLNTKKELESLAFDINKNYNSEFIYNYEDVTKIQKIKYYGEDFGIITTSNVKSNGNVDITSIQPYFETNFIQRLKNISIQEVSPNVHIAYGVEEYSNVVMLFFIQNHISDFFDDTKSITGDRDVKLYGVSSNCKVILPSNSSSVPDIFDENFDLGNFLKNPDNFFENFLNSNKPKNELITINNIFEKLKEYVHYVGHNKYEFLGTITSVETARNKLSNIKIYKIVIDISGIYLDVLVSEEDLYGLPILGMRLLGSFKLCGEILKDFY